VATNETKTLALLLADGWPTVWGDSPLSAVAAYRMVCQLNENAKLPGAWGALPEAAHNQIVAFDGRYGARAAVVDDLFRDPVEDGPPPPRTQLVVLRDPAADPADARRCDLAVELATARGLRPFTVTATDGPAVVRLASLVGMCDWASVYTALALGEDPTPIEPIRVLKARLSG
jgi:glucose/mannose-6-phosphate isomerase